MHNFFLENAKNENGRFCITGADFFHIKNVLRMRISDKLYVSVGSNTHLCAIEDITDSEVLVKIIEENAIDTTLPISITLFQGLPKADKMELIIQKAVELGADFIVPVEMKNSVVKIEQKKKQAKRERWQAIAESGAKQSKRNTIPQVISPMSFKESIEKVKELDLILVPYENKRGMQDTIDALSLIKKDMKIGVYIGSEGGFDLSEIDALTEQGAKIISLGKRILRTETAAITTLSMLMLYAEAII